MFVFIIIEFYAHILLARFYVLLSLISNRYELKESIYLLCHAGTLLHIIRNHANL